VIIGGGIFWLNRSAQASVNVSATLSVYQPETAVARSGGTYTTSANGTQVQAGDSVKTDTKGRASIGLPDGTLTRLASQTEITLNAAHFTKSGTLNDAKLTEKIGRTLTSVQHLVSGALFQVSGQSAVAGDDQQPDGVDLLVLGERPLADRLHAWLTHASTPGLTGERRAVLEGVVLGEDGGLSDTLRQRFRASGLYHLLASAEACRAHRGEAVVSTHEVRARSILRLAATSPDPVTARRARIALVRLGAGVAA